MKDSLDQDRSVSYAHFRYTIFYRAEAADARWCETVGGESQSWKGRAENGAWGGLRGGVRDGVARLVLEGADGFEASHHALLGTGRAAEIAEDGIDGRPARVECRPAGRRRHARPDEERCPDRREVDRPHRTGRREVRRVVELVQQVVTVLAGIHVDRRLAVDVVARRVEVETVGNDGLRVRIWHAVVRALFVDRHVPAAAPIPAEAAVVGVVRPAAVVGLGRLERLRIDLRRDVAGLG